METDDVEVVVLLATAAGNTGTYSWPSSQNPQVSSRSDDSKAAAHQISIPNAHGIVSVPKIQGPGKRIQALVEFEKSSGSELLMYWQMRRDDPGGSNIAHCKIDTQPRF